MTLTDSVWVVGYFHFLSRLRFLNFYHMLPSFPLVNYLQKNAFYFQLDFFLLRSWTLPSLLSCPSYVQVCFFRTWSSPIHWITNLFSTSPTLGPLLYSWGDFCVKSPAGPLCTCFCVSIHPFIHWTYLLPSMLLGIRNPAVNKIDGNVFP